VKHAHLIRALAIGLFWVLCAGLYLSTCAGFGGYFE